MSNRQTRRSQRRSAGGRGRNPAEMRRRSLRVILVLAVVGLIAFGFAQMGSVAFVAPSPLPTI